MSILESVSNINYIDSDNIVNEAAFYKTNKDNLIKVKYITDDINKRISSVGKYRFSELQPKKNGYTKANKSDDFSNSFCLQLVNYGLKTNQSDIDKIKSLLNDKYFEDLSKRLEKEGYGTFKFDIIINKLHSKIQVREIK